MTYTNLQLTGEREEIAELTSRAASSEMSACINHFIQQMHI